MVSSQTIINTAASVSRKIEMMKTFDILSLTLVLLSYSFANAEDEEVLNDQLTITIFSNIIINIFTQPQLG